MLVAFEPHPLLDAVAFETELGRALGEIDGRPIVDLLRADAKAPLSATDEVRTAVRDLLRKGGYKPTGRGKPASEYLVRAAAEGTLSSINAAVDICNAVSLHSGLPISVVDFDRVTPLSSAAAPAAPLEAKIAPPGSSYVFNASGQTIDVSGLLCLFDADGPTANAVKDAQRTKTHAGTTRTVTVIWGTNALDDRTARAFEWYKELLASIGARLGRANSNRL